MLLILCRGGRRTNGDVGFPQEVQGLTCRKQRSALATIMPSVGYPGALVYFGNGTKVEMLEIALVKQIRREVVLVKSLLYGNDCTILLVMRRLNSV